MTIDCDRPDFIIRGGLWDGYKLFDLYKQAYTPWEWTGELFQLGNDLGIDIFSSPFDETAVDFLEQYAPPAYKIASLELTDSYLLKKLQKLVGRQFYQLGLQLKRKFGPLLMCFNKMAQLKFACYIVSVVILQH